MEDIEIYEIEERPDFEKNISRLVRKKKFFSLPKQIRELKTKLSRGEFEGGQNNSQRRTYAIRRI